MHIAEFYDEFSAYESEISALKINDACIEEVSKALIDGREPLIMQEITKELVEQMRGHINEKEIIERYWRLMKYGKQILEKYGYSRQYPYAIKDTNRNV